MADPFTAQNYAKSIIWVAVVGVLSALSAYKAFTTLDAQSNPGPFFIITTFVLLLVFVKGIVRIVLIRRGLPKG